MSRVAALEAYMSQRTDHLVRGGLTGPTAIPVHKYFVSASKLRQFPHKGRLPKGAVNHTTIQTGAHATEEGHGWATLRVKETNRRGRTRKIN